MFLLDENDPETIRVTPDGHLDAENETGFARHLIDSGASEHGWSKAETAIRCPRQWALRYAATDAERGCPTPAPAAPLCRGILVHCGLAHFYEQVRWQQHGRSVEDFRAVYFGPGEAMKVRARRLVDVEGCNPAEVAGYLELASAACRVYFAQYGVDAWEIVAVEKLLVVRPEVFQEVTGVACPKPFTTRIDLVIRDSRRKIIFWDHKCVPAAAKLRTSLGTTTVGTFTGGLVSSWDESQQRLCLAEASAPRFAGVQDAWQIALGAGRTLTVGHTHPILTRRGWVEAQHVRSDDRVAVPHGGLDWPRAKVTDAELRFVAHMTTDGALKTLRWAKASIPVVEDFGGCLTAMGLVESSEGKRDGDYTRATLNRTVAGKSRLTQFRYSLSQTPGAKGAAILARLGVARVGSPERVIPHALTQGSLAQARVLVGALWDGDGAAYLRTQGGVQIVYTSRSIPLCEQVQELLTRLGIVSSLTRTTVAYRGERRPYAQVMVIGAESKRRFLQTVRLLRADVPALLAVLAERVHSSNDTREARLEHGVYWDTVKSALFVGKQPMFDISVPATRTFVCDGVVTHNTTAAGLSAARYTLAGGVLSKEWIGHREHGAEFGGVKINMIGWRGVTPRTDRNGTVTVSDAAAIQCKRFSLDPAPFAVARWPYDYVSHSQRLVELRVKTIRNNDGSIKAVDKRSPWEYPGADSEQVCETKYGTCEFLEMCRWGPPVKRG